MTARTTPPPDLGPEQGVTVTKVSAWSVSDTVSRLSELIHASGMTLFATIDQRAHAQRAGLDLRETVLVIFGAPSAGTAVMAASPLAALDLPLKVLIWAENNHTNVTYTPPAELARRYGLSAGLTTKLAGIDTLTDTLVAPDARGG